MYMETKTTNSKGNKMEKLTSKETAAISNAVNAMGPIAMKMFPGYTKEEIGAALMAFGVREMMASKID